MHINILFSISNKLYHQFELVDRIYLSKQNIHTFAILQRLNSFSLISLLTTLKLLRQEGRTSQQTILCQLQRPYQGTCRCP